MEQDAYREMAEIQDRHWWFVGRRAIIEKILAGLRLPAEADILEIGAGTGGNIVLLSRFGNVVAVEMNDYARAFAEKKTGRPIAKGWLPDGLPELAQRFDLICLFDVLEHIERDAESLAALRGLLKPQGKLLITVPAYQWLWSRHDEQLHHKRRYAKSGLAELLAQAGYRVEYATYFNLLLFPLACAARLVDRLLGRNQAAGQKLPRPTLNRFFGTLLEIEVKCLPKVSLPFGLSLLAHAQPE